MYPVLLQFGDIVITSFGVFLTLAFLVFMFVIVRLMNKQELDSQFFTEHLLSLFTMTLVGSKVLYWLLNIERLYADLLFPVTNFDVLGVFIILFNIEEFYIAGGILTFAALFSAYMKRSNKNILYWLDAIIPSISLALSVGFIGSFLGGYYVGRPTGSFLGMLFSGDPAYSYAARLYTVPIHPIQLYSAFSTLVIFFILLEVSKKIKIEGVVGVVGLLLLSLQNVLIEFFRGADNIVTFYGITLNQYVSILGIICAIYLFTKKVPRIVG